MSGRSKLPLVPIPDRGIVDFTKRIRDTSVRFLNQQRPVKDTLDEFLVLPLYQTDQDMPLDNDGKTSLLLAHIDVLRQIVADYDRKMAAGGS